MLHYFYVFDERPFREVLMPALADCERLRTFAALHRLVDASPAPGPDSVLIQAQKQPFERRLFQAVVGESLVAAAREMPRFPLDPEVVAALVTPGRLDGPWSERATMSPIEQVFWGSRDLRIGSAWHRPFKVGWNGPEDARRLREFLTSIDVALWTPKLLEPVSSLPNLEDRVEELELVREWWGELCALYGRLADEPQVLVCEEP